MKTRILIALALIFFIRARARADSLLVGTQLSTDVYGGLVLGGGGGTYAPQFAAQGFTLTSPADVTVAEIGLTVDGDESLLLQLSSVIGPNATAADILAQADINTVPAPNGALGQVFFLPVYSNLPSGTYYLVASSTDPSGVVSWPFFGGFGLPPYTPLPTVDGAPQPSFYVAYQYSGGVNESFPPASTWAYQAPDPPVQFQVYGNVVAASEGGSTSEFLLVDLIAFAIAAYPFRLNQLRRRRRTVFQV